MEVRVVLEATLKLGACGAFIVIDEDIGAVRPNSCTRRDKIMQEAVKPAVNCSTPAERKCVKNF
jgi:hypothetical protein